jgi:sulfate permease, SulP family
MPTGASTAHILRPKLLAVLRDGYSAEDFRRDAIAAFTVAIVALPLSMAIAVASGVSPDRGLVTAVVGGFIVSALSGSRYQIGGPAGAFIVLVAATVAQIGLAGLVVAVALSGAFLVLLGLLRIGSLVRHMPYAVTVGFTGGIALTILASQLKDLAGLTLAGPEPGAFLPKLAALATALPSANAAALALGLGTAAIIFLVRCLRPAWPAMLIGVVLSTAIAALASLPVETVQSRFGGIPHGLPMPALPDFSPGMIWRALPAALSFTLLGAVESLLSAKVADAMTGRVHRSNMELIGQGVANVASAFFGGICVTGTIARTATNIRAGARTPVAGMLHAGFLLLFMLVAAPLAGFIPLSTLAGVLVVVAWNMVEKKAFADLLRAWPGAVVVLTTLALTLLHDLIAGIVAGCIVAAGLALLRRQGGSSPPQ